MPRLILRADAGVGAIAVSPTSRDAVLAGRSGLYVVDLHDPFALPRWLPLRSAWEVACVQWCPHAQRPACLASTSNHKTLIWNLALTSDRAVEHVLHGHLRAVTDIDFSPFHPDQLATASIDTTIRIWDVRQARNAVMSFADFHAGAIQTKWNALNDNQITSAHDNRFVLWDKRRANLPVANVHAHQGECNGLQFLANGKLLTCSTDRTIKTWDLNKTSSENYGPEVQIEAGFPVWRTIPTPFELGALVVPLRGGDNSVSLINLARQTGIKTLKDVQIGEKGFSHPDSVSNAVFMRNEDSASHYDIVTWCRDSHLREWNGSILQDLPHASSAAGCKDDLPPPLPSNRCTFNTDDFDKITSGNLNTHDVFDLPLLNQKTRDEIHAIGHLDWIAGVRIDRNKGEAELLYEPQKGKKQEASNTRDSVASSEQLSQDIISVSSRFPKVRFEDINIGNGTCEFILNGPWGVDNNIVPLRAKARIPHGYPNQPMNITMTDDTGICEGALGAATSVLNESMLELSRHGVHSLEFAVQFLVGEHVSVEDFLANEGPLLDQFSDRSIDSYKADIDGDFIEFGNEDEDVVGDLRKSGDKWQQSSEDNGSTNSSLCDDDSSSNFDGNERNHLTSHDSERDDIIDSTPLPKNCGAVWSPTGMLVCFFNRRSVGKDKGPLPLDKVFADDNRSDDDSPFLSDSDDFETDNHDTLLQTTANWSVTAAQLMANPNISVNPSTSAAAVAAASNGGASGMFLPLKNTSGISVPGRNRSRTLTSAASDERSTSLKYSTVSNVSHTVVIKNMLHLWPCRPDVAAEYQVYLTGEPLEIAEHNANVAAKYGLHDDENIWRFIHAYIRVEEAEASHPQTSIITERIKFDWCGGSTGLRSYMAAIASELEKQGKIQLLACISLVFSSLRGQRDNIRKKTKHEYPTGDEMIIIKPREECIFQAHPDGSVNVFNRKKASSLPRNSTPVEHTGSFINQQDNSWPDSFDGLTMENTASRRHSLRPLRTPSYQQESMNHEYVENAGPLIGVEIDNDVFDFDHPPSSILVMRGESKADEDFSSWLPRLLGYRMRYASLLQYWGLNVKRAEVVKLNRVDSLIVNKHHEINMSRNAMDEWIDIEMTKQSQCAFCNSPITRLFEYCERCSHAMHSECAEQWWTVEHECPSACGCDCKQHVM